jgi:hypothetical protein
VYRVGAKKCGVNPRRSFWIEFAFCGDVGEFSAKLLLCVSLFLIVGEVVGEVVGEFSAKLLLCAYSRRSS